MQWGEGDTFIVPLACSHDQVHNTAEGGNRVRVCGFDEVGRVNGESPCVVSGRVRRIWKCFHPGFDVGTCQDAKLDVGKKVFLRSMDP